MSWTKDVTIWCDGDNGCCVTHLQTNKSYTARARIEAEEKGWETSLEKDLCPKCK